MTENTPLTPMEQAFLTNYIRLGNYIEAVRATPGLENRKKNACSALGKRWLQKPNVQAEMRRIMEEVRKDTIATADEVMQYFTAVMRGEVKDQFGLDATLADRTRAAQEIARRTIDIENRKAGEPDQLVAIKLDWSRDNKEEA